MYPGGIVTDRAGVCKISGLHPDSLPPPAGTARRASRPERPTWKDLWEPRETIWLPSPLLPAGAWGLPGRTTSGGPLLPQTCEFLRLGANVLSYCILFLFYDDHSENEWFASLLFLCHYDEPFLSAEREFRAVCSLQQEQASVRRSDPTA